MSSHDDIDLVDDEMDDGQDAHDDLPFDIDAFGALGDEIDVFPMDGCAIKRGERELFLFDGQRFWLHPVIPASLHNSYVRFAGGVQDESLAAMSGPFDDIRAGLARCVVGWDLVDPVTGEPYPQPWKNAAVFADIPTPAMYWILNAAIKGEVPAERPNGSTPRRGGSGTRRYTGQKTRNTRVAPRRR